MTGLGVWSIGWLAIAASPVYPRHGSQAAPVAVPASRPRTHQRRLVRPLALSAEEGKLRSGFQYEQSQNYSGLAMNDFDPRNGRFPAAVILGPAEVSSKESKPVLSWKLSPPLLPYLNQRNLYDKFHRDEPWDSPHNKALLDQIPKVYVSVVPKGEPKGYTYYQVFSGKGAMFEGNRTPPGVPGSSTAPR